MKLGGRIQAAIEVLTDIETQHTPATDALRDWGKAHRFAGSKDRSFIGNVVHDALRQKSSLGWKMGADTPRAVALGNMVFNWGVSVADLNAAFADDVHSPKALSKAEEAALTSGGQSMDLAPDWVRADIPEWIWPAFEANFDEDAVAEGQAMATRPPLDLRVNTIKSTVDAALEKLSEFNITRSPIAATGLRFASPEAEGRLPNVQPEAIFQTGGVEIQDEGSQIAALLVNAKPGETVLDFCAGGGGKSLALAADMQNTGKIYAYDVDRLLVYVTCSLLAEENEAQVYAFLEEHPEFQILSAGEVWEDRFGTDGPKPWSADACSVTLTPASTNTDGFFFSVMEKGGIDANTGYRPEDD